MYDISRLLRPNIVHALDAAVEREQHSEPLRFDRNVSPFNAPLSRYPDAADTALCQAVSRQSGLRPDCIAVHHGVTEAVDILLRLFCSPREDNIVTTTPSRALVRERAALADVTCHEVPLDVAHDFGVSVEALLSAADERTKLIFLCSPGSPSGVSLRAEVVLGLADAFDGLVVLDASYADFSPRPSLYKEVAHHPNLVVLTALNSAWAAAALTVGISFAVPEVTRLMRQVGLPHPISAVAAHEAERMLSRRTEVEQWVNVIREERARMMAAMAMLPFCDKVFPSETNFFLVRLRSADRIWRWLCSQGVRLHRPFSPLLADCLRITIGSAADNSRLLSLLRQIKG